MAGGFRFADFELNAEAYTLTRSGERVALENIPMEILLLLVRRAGLLVGRAEIHQQIWGRDVFIDRDAALNTALRKLRVGLGDPAGQPRFIETVVGKGYRFIAPVDRPLYSPAPYRTYIVRRGNHEFALNEGETVLGRDPHSHIHIEHPSVSRRHARISVQADKLMLEDLASRNGTFVDGRKITGPVQLRDGTIIGLGAIALTFGVSRAPASTQPVGDVPGSLATESES